MDKMKLAHEYAMKCVGNPNSTLNTNNKIVDFAWAYADAMQVEAENREKEEAEQKRKEMRELLNTENTFIERDGQHFDDVCGDEIHAQRDAELYGVGFLKVTYDSNGVKYDRLDPKLITLNYPSQEEQKPNNFKYDGYASNPKYEVACIVAHGDDWQPDWSQAPEWANWWIRESAGSYWWLQTRPVKEKNHWLHKNRDSKSMLAPSFGYTGTWQDSLRKRPQ